MSDLIATSLAMAFTADALFDDVSLTIDPGDRIALVGPNGAGKTTLLRVLAGVLAPTGGQVRVPEHIRVALHDQRPERTSEPLREYAAPTHMVQMEAHLRRLEIDMATGDADVLNEYDEVRSRYDAAGGESWVALVESVLRGLGFTEQQLDQSLDTFSGGELTRASLARALACSPDILLLDEPTNHLDMETIDWLSEHLSSIRGGVIMVSHDRWFIESTCTSVVEIVQGKARRFKGSFVEYRTQQALEAVTFQRHLEHWQTEMARLQRFVDKFSAGTRSRQAQSRVKMMEKLRSDAPQYADLRERRGIGFSLPAPERSGATALDVRGISLGFPEAGRTLLQPTDFVVERGEKIALLGRNGSGKSTLLAAIAAACIPHTKAPEGMLSGEVRVGYGTTARLLSQHDSELVDTMSMLGNMHLAAPDIVRRQAMSLLGLFGFRGPDAERLVGTLSGGERRRLLLAQALTGSANLLLIDEPTNHLDIESREALEAALAEYEGTLVLISHDRALVEGVATRTIVLHDETITTVRGGYTEAREMLSGGATAPAHTPDPAPVKPADRRAPQPKQKAGAGRTVKRSSGEPAGEVRRRGRSKPSASTRVRRPATIEREIETLEARMSEINELMLDPEVYTSPERSADALKEHDVVERDIAARYQELEQAMEHFG